ncbi:putative scp-like extracellular protein [Diaporthe ampelina]|uniref:Putative scp-like extracellular protein n=1 Tax=Diaporthe ampelina TaxID=1214573 RepID=A0A0G2FXP4_9PEZI|nr:putative scp-like extracellular protein [Diaporthe ampelina]
MQFSTRSALAALLMATDALACGKGYHHRTKPTTLSTIVIATPVPSSTPVATILPTVVEPSSSPASSSSSSSSVVVEPSTTSSSTSAASTPTTPATSGLTTDEQAALDSQNSARADVGATALTWDAGLASDALEWAQHLASTAGSSGSLTHSTTTSDGENLYWQSNSDSPYANAANAWVGEKDLYNGEAITGSGNFEEYGHYTQIIWASTSKIGMAVASDGSGGYYVVARYNPAGNVIGETPSSG